MLIFPNYTAKVIERLSFSKVMSLLRELKVGHILRFPAKLCFSNNGNTKMFVSPADAKLYVEKELRQSVEIAQE